MGKLLKDKKSDKYTDSNVLLVHVTNNKKNLTIKSVGLKSQQPIVIPITALKYIISISAAELNY